MLTVLDSSTRSQTGGMENTGVNEPVCRLRISRPRKVPKIASLPRLLFSWGLADLVDICPRNCAEHIAPAAVQSSSMILSSLGQNGNG